jgi:hypothetical protein
MPLTQKYKCFPLSDQVKESYLLFLCLMTGTVIYLTQYLCNKCYFRLCPVKSDQPALFDNIPTKVLLKRITCTDLFTHKALHHAINNSFPIHLLSDKFTAYTTTGRVKSHLSLINILKAI